MKYPDGPVNVTVLDFATAKREAVWGTYGKGGAEHCAGTCPEHQLRWKRLIDCDTDHLQMILQNQRHVRYSNVRTIIESILKDRGVEPKEFSLEAEREFLVKVYAKLPKQETTDAPDANTHV